MSGSVMRDSGEIATGPGARRRRAGVAVLVAALGLGLGLASGVGPSSAADGAAGGPVAGPGTGVPGPQLLPVGLDRAGAYVGWGSALADLPGGVGIKDVGQWTLPPDLDGVALREVVAGRNVTLALTADGRVRGWGQNIQHTEQVPGAVASMDVIDIASSETNAGVVAADGRVLVWGNAVTGVDDPTDVPDDLAQPAAPGTPRPVQLALTQGTGDGFAVMSDHTVRAWGNPGSPGWPSYVGMLDVPEGLRATQVVAVTSEACAVRTDATVTCWGHESGSMWTPPPATESLDENGQGQVVAIGTVGAAGGFYALLDDGTTVAWGISCHPGPTCVPDLGTKKAVAIASDGGVLVQDEDGVLHPGYPGSGFVTVPPELTGTPIARFSLSQAIGGFNAAAIVTRMLRAAPPAVTGVAQAGSGTLTGTPGTFSDTPDAITSQWLVNGTPVTGSATSTLSLASYPAGTKIAYRSTATKAGQDTISSTSTAVVLKAAPKPPAPAKVASRTKIKKIKVTKKAGKLTVTGKVAAAKAPAGKVKVVIKKGKKTIVSKTVKVKNNGTFKFKVRKFGHKVAKKLHKKGRKAKRAYRGTYKIKAGYHGNAHVKPSKTTKKFKIKK